MDHRFSSHFISHSRFLLIHHSQARPPQHPLAPSFSRTASQMATAGGTASSNAITLKGSVDIVTEFLGARAPPPLPAARLVPAPTTAEIPPPTLVAPPNRLQHQQHLVPARGLPAEQLHAGTEVRADDAGHERQRTAGVHEPRAQADQVLADEPPAAEAGDRGVRRRLRRDAGALGVRARV